MNRIIIWLFLSGAPLAASANTLHGIDNFEKLKRDNARITSGCLDLGKMNATELQFSLAVFDSFVHSKENESTKSERQKGIETSLRATGISDRKVLFIFARRPSLATKPGMALRSESRTALAQKIDRFASTDPSMSDKQKVIRFDDECSIPDRCNDYVFESGLKAKLMSFGCK